MRSSTKLEKTSPIYADSLYSCYVCLHTSSSQLALVYELLFELLGLVLVSWLFLGLGNQTGRIVLVAHVLLVEVLQTELDCNEASRSVFLLLSYLPHLDYSRKVYLLQLRELIGEQPSYQKGFADETAICFDRDEFIIFQEASADGHVLLY